MDEEEHDLFPKLEKEMSQEERDELGQQLQERTHELQGPPPNGTSGVPKGRRAAGGARGEGAHSSGRRGH